jgi:ankyrin repeat protein
MEDFGDFAVDIISLIREGNVLSVKNWISQALAADTETKSQKMKEVYGTENNWGCNMSGLIWAIDIEDKQAAMEISNMLLEAFPVLINITDSVKSSPLHYASLNGDSNMIQLLFSKGMEIVLDNNEENALHSATLNGHVDATKVLLKKGVNPNQQNIDGCTPLHHAVLNNQLKVVNLLTLHPKINLGIKNNAGQTALDIALTKKNPDLCALFEQEKNDNLEEIFELEDEISNLQQRISYITSLNEIKKNETHAIYKKLAEIEALHDDAKRQEEQITLSSPPPKKVNNFENLISEAKSEIEREEQLSSVLQQKLQNNTTPSQANDTHNEESLQNMYTNLVSTVKLFEAIKLGLTDAIQPIDSLCKLIKPDHTKVVIELNKESNQMDVISDERQHFKPNIAGFLI